jgi:hypothetical protein
VELATLHALQDDDVTTGIDHGNGDCGAAGGRPGDGGVNHRPGARVREALAICDIHGGDIETRQ